MVKQNRSHHSTCSIADGHGTHCSGIIGAVDNAQGVRGVIGSGVNIHAYACLNETGSGGESDVGFAAAGWLRLGMPAPRAAMRVAKADATSSALLLAHLQLQLRLQRSGACTAWHNNPLPPTAALPPAPPRPLLQMYAGMTSCVARLDSMQRNKTDGKMIVSMSLGTDISDAATNKDMQTMIAEWNAMFKKLYNREWAKGTGPG